MFLHPKPSMEGLKDVYDDHYFSNEEFFNVETINLYGYVDYISERINKQYIYSKIVRQAKDLLQLNLKQVLNKPKWLDIGCGLGYLIDVAFDNGFAVKGTEFNEYAVQYMRSKYVYPVECGIIEDIEFDEKFDVVSMMDVIEHLQDPFGDMIRIKELMKTGGILIILTMDSDSLMSRIMGKKLEDFRRFREHLFFFGKKSLSAILDQNGFEIQSINSIGHTFQLKLLIDRIGIYSPLLSKVIRKLIYPRWLLDANFYINPHTKMILFARKL
jgi:2-polyprenyl-3-methyl-5-hydroxy-6-metoxy-1,4-benzoquinol methylase